MVTFFVGDDADGSGLDSSRLGGGRLPAFHTYMIRPCLAESKMVTVEKGDASCHAYIRCVRIYYLHRCIRVLQWVRRNFRTPIMRQILKMTSS